MDLTSNSDLIPNVVQYYNQKLHQYGPVPRGVDWNGEPSQKLRFQQFTNLLRSPSTVSTVNRNTETQANDHTVSVLDYGCGYGAYYEFLQQQNLPFLIRYFGYDISEEMIFESQKRFNKLKGRFMTSIKELDSYDYSVASGVFNVKLESETERWERYIQETLQHIWEISSSGFAFNMLTAFSDEDRKRTALYYGNPSWWLGYCMKTFSRHCALLHDYGLYEFTLFVRRQP